MTRNAVLFNGTAVDGSRDELAVAQMHGPLLPRLSGQPGV